jgi:glycosyltransferase involved in cell wall biosynthesis
LVDRYPQAQLFMAGDGPLLAHCKLLVQELAMTKNIFFPGVLKHEMVAGFMQKSIAFVQHSVVASTGDSEGTPVAIMEASAAALPVIATRHAGIPDVILDGVTGILIPEKNIDQMADAMLKLILNKALAKRMGEAGRERMKTHFSMERYIKVLRNALEA